MFLLRAVLVIAHVLFGVGIGLYIAFGFGGEDAPQRLGKMWHTRLLRIFDIRVRAEGTALMGPHLTVANHVSWLDIPVIGALEETRFVAKSEVREWPVANLLANAGGTFYIRRGRGGSGPTLERITPHLKHRGSVTVFPEGTTTDGGNVLPFHPRLFAAAIEAKRPVQPVTICYSTAPNGRAVAPFIGDDDLVSHIWRLLRNPGLEVVVRYGPPLQPGDSREALAAEAETYVRAALEPAPRPSLPSTFCDHYLEIVARNHHRTVA